MRFLGSSFLISPQGLQIGESSPVLRVTSPSSTGPLPGLVCEAETTGGLPEDIWKILHIYNATIENLKSGHRTDCITLISLDYFVFPIVSVLKAVSGTCHSPSDT